MKKIWVHKAHSFKEADEFDIKFWRRAGALARFSATWLMIGEFFKIKGKYGYKPRLRRTVQNIERL
ncbi:MAG: hypothetical protein FJZ16_04575 [Candidatus Omnitrophica bacterium]|nr:hypothetical protein [Candidatus Omnitrophota bacterium]